MDNNVIDNPYSSVFQTDYKELLTEYKSKHLTIWNFIHKLLELIQGYTIQLKKGWLYAITAAEKLASDIANIKNDIAEIKKEINKDPDNPVKPSEASVKKLANDYKQYKTDVQELSDKIPDIKDKTDPSIVEIAKELNRNILNIGDTTDSKGNKFDKLLEAVAKGGKTDDLRSALQEIGTKDKKSEDYKIDDWTNGRKGEEGTYLEGLEVLDTKTGDFKNEGQRKLNTFETKINTFNNISSNVVKEISTFLTDSVRNQVTS